MNNEYISKKEVLDYLNGYLHLLGYDNTDLIVNGQRHALINVLEDILTVKAADVQPVRHGRWITKAEDYYKKWQNSGRSWDDMPYFVTGEHIACSECFTEYDVCTEGIEHWTGCPCCLVRMEGDSE